MKSFLLILTAGILAVGPVLADGPAPAQTQLHLEVGGGATVSNAGSGAVGAIALNNGDGRNGSMELTAGAQVTPQGQVQPLGHMALTAPFEGSNWFYMGDPNFIQSDGVHNAFSLFPLDDIHIKNAHGFTDINYMRMVLLCDRTNKTCYGTLGVGVFTQQQISQAWSIIASANAGYGADMPMKSGEPSQNLNTIAFAANLGVRYKAGQKTFIEPSLQVMDNTWWKTQGPETGVRSSDPVMGLTVKVLTPVL